MRLCGRYQVHNEVPIKITLRIVGGFDFKSNHFQIHGITPMVEVYLLRLSFSRNFSHQYPNAGHCMITEPCNLVRSKVNHVSSGCLEFDEMEVARVVASQNIRDAGHRPRFNPRSLPSSRAFRYPCFHQPPQVGFSLCRGFGNCSLLRE
jgi:hypothetical protein